MLNSDKLRLEVAVLHLINDWLNSSRFQDHFYTTSEEVRCKCPTKGPYSSWDATYSAVGFLWFKDAKIMARPLNFWMASGPENLTDIADPKCLEIAEERLNHLHEFFKRDRAAGVNPTRP